MLKTIIKKLKRKIKITETLMWFNQSVATINATLQFLDIYIYIYIERERDLCAYKI